MFVRVLLYVLMSLISRKCGIDKAKETKRPSCKNKKTWGTLAVIWTCGIIFGLKELVCNESLTEVFITCFTLRRACVGNSSCAIDISDLEVRCTVVLAQRHMASYAFDYHLPCTACVLLLIFN